MAEINLKKIAERLNNIFDNCSSDIRQLVFWYDEKQEFAEDISSLVLNNAKIYHLEENNQFYTKYFFECVDKENNYLVYAPFAKPDVKNNHLEDIILYSKRFNADKASLLCAQMGIKEQYKPVIEQYIKYFANKDRTQRFFDLQIDDYNERTIPLGIMCALSKTHTCSLEEILRGIYTGKKEPSNLISHPLLDEFDKYGLLEEFWKACKIKYDFKVSGAPNLEQLLATMFLTYVDRHIEGGLPKEFHIWLSNKSGNIIVFLDNILNNASYRERYEELSQYIGKTLNIEQCLGNYDADSLIECDLFLGIDRIIIKWIVERLMNQDTGAKLKHYSISEVCEKRMKMHFGYKTANTYEMLRSAYYIIVAKDYKPFEIMNDIVNNYVNKDYKVDQEYRNFYFSFDSLNNSAPFEQLKELVENIYTNEFLGQLLPKWNEALGLEGCKSIGKEQYYFFDNYVKNSKERTVVIISDAFRYEVGRELFELLSDDKRYDISMEANVSMLPSYTRLGMGALLPHKSLELADDYEVYVDGILCNGLDAREKVLSSHIGKAKCVQFNSLTNMKKDELREVFNGQKVVYVYHNQIDARGDKVPTENEVFVACKEAVHEISDLIRRLAINANIYRFVVTADHGFIYKRNKVTESDKIAGISNADGWINRRYIVARKPIGEAGIRSVQLGTILHNSDEKYVSFPVSHNVFKVPGGGQNFVHGGSSPEEMIIPVIQIKAERGHMETRSATIELLSSLKKVTNQVTLLDFIQKEPVSDNIKKSTYKMYFVNATNDAITNENVYNADSRETEDAKRTFRLKFTFVDKTYNRNEKYAFVIVDATRGFEIYRKDVIIDLAFSDDYGW